MKKHLTRITAAFLTFALLLSVSVFAADPVVMTYIVKEGAAVNPDDGTIESTYKTDDPGVRHEVIKNVGDDVYAQIYLKPDRSVAGTADIWIEYDEGFLKLASGGSGYVQADNDKVVSDITLNTDPGFLISAQIGTQVYHGENERRITLMAKIPESSSETWVATIHFKVARENPDETEGWVRVRPPENPSPRLVYWTNWMGDYKADHNLTEDLRVVLPATVTFDSKGGSEIADSPFTIAVGSTATKPADPTRDGYTFGFWTLDDTAANPVPYDFTTPVTSDITLKAVWSELPHTVTWKDGDTVLETDREVPRGAQPDFSDGGTPAPTKDGKVFDGWSTDPNAVTGTPEAELDPVGDGDVTYYAIFKDAGFTVTWKTQDGNAEYEKDTGVENGSQPSYDGVEPTKTADATYTYTFAGWATAEDAETGTPAASLPPVTKDITYYAAFSKAPIAGPGFTVTWKVDGETTETDENVAKDAKPTYNQLEPTKPGAVFAGWSENPDDTSGQPASKLPGVSKDTTYHAIFTTNAYTVTWKSQDGTTTYETDENVPYGAEPSFDQDNPAMTGATFAGWATSTNQKAGTLEEDLPAVTGKVTYYAAFTTDTFTVKWVVDGATKETDSNVPYGTSPSYDKAEPTKANKNFAGWSTDPNATSGVPEGSLPGVTGNTTYHAVFTDKPTYTVTWKSQDGETTYETDKGVIDGTQPDYNGKTPAKESDATYTYIFAGWSTAEDQTSGKAEDSLPAVTGDVTYYAAFSPTRRSSGGSGTVSYSVEVAPTSGGSVSVSPTTRVPAGTTVTITPKPDDGKALSRLTVTGPNGTSVPTERETDGTYVFIMPKGDVTVRAVFAGNIASPDDTGVSRLLNTDDHIWYLSGYVEGDIRPLGNMTRAEAAQAFFRLLRRPEVELTKSFPDVADGVWYTKAIRTLASMGILNGRGGVNFWPNKPITRAEFAALATRFAKATGGTATFSDVPETHWAHDNIATAADYGWINGDGNGSFRPEKLITRAEVATIINHMLNRAADQSYVAAHKGELNQFSDLQDAAQWYYLDMVESSNAHLYDRNTGSETWTKLTGDELKD